MNKTKYALFLYHRLKDGFEKWEFRRDVITAHPDLYLEELFPKIYGLKIKGGTEIDTRVMINNTNFQKLYIVYAGGKEMALAKRY